MASALARGLQGLTFQLSTGTTQQKAINSALHVCRRSLAHRPASAAPVCPPGLYKSPLLPSTHPKSAPLLNDQIKQETKPTDRGSSCTARHGSSSSPSPRPRRRRTPRGGGPALLHRRSGRHGAGGDGGRARVQLRPPRRARSCALGPDQSRVGQLQRRADAVAHRPPPRARLPRPRPRLPQPLLPPRRRLHRQPRPRHHGEVQRRRRERGDQRHGVLSEAAALALADGAHRRRAELRHGAAPGARERGGQGGGDRDPLRGRRARRVPARAGAGDPADRRPAGPRGARRRGGPARRARQGQRVLPLPGVTHHAALHRGGHLDRRQEGSHRVEVPAGASQGSRTRRHGEEREAGAGGERQRHQHLPAQAP